MDQKEIGQKIKALRIKNNLTQQKLAEMLGVTYQAVSKWETGKNIPDLAILQLISEKFKVDMQALLMGKVKANKSKRVYILVNIMVFILMLLLFFIFNNQQNFEFKDLKSENTKFDLSGVIAFSKTKTALYISNVKANFKDDTLYKLLECTLYEANGNHHTQISKCGDISDDPYCEVATLEELLQGITFHIDNFVRSCKYFENSYLYLEINALDLNNKTIKYKIPLILNESC